MVGILVFGWCSGASAEKVVIASTSLAGAISRAAGAKEIRVLTPAEMKHPPEYEVKPSDLMKLQGAAVAVYGGYEKMVPRLIEAAGNNNILPVPINTKTSPDNLLEQARRIAKVLGTEQEEQAWESRFQAKLKELRQRLAPFSGMRAVVHMHAEPFARFADLNIVKIVMGGELTPKTIAESIAAGPQLVLDILHLPLAKVISENAKCPYVQIINFPGVARTETLEDIFEYNTLQVLKARE